jgi:Protein of unknown function (DUF997)
MNGYRRSRREAIVAGLLWAVAALWTVSASYVLGYGQPAKSLWGIPSWVVWGVFLPWAVFFVIHCWYSLVYLRDDDEK